MKLNTKAIYDQSDIKRLIRAHMALQGLEVSDDDIVLKSNVATVTVDMAVEIDPKVPLFVPDPEAPVAASQAVVATQEPPRLHAVAGGAGPVDMSGVLGESQRLARSTEGPFAPKQHSMLDGESFEFPGNDK